jgi:3-deoxy-D-manno-octulosonic-acid transferase
MSGLLGLYRLLSPLLPALAAAAAPFAPKLRAGLAWRRERPALPAALAALAARSPRYWLHAASAGELEQARPLLAGLRARHPEAALLLTLSSISARAAGERLSEADLVLPLPLDTPRAMGSLLAAYRPQAVIAVKWDLWPNLLLEAERRGIPALLLGAVLGADSGRARWPGRLLTAPLYRRLAGIGAASAADASAFAALGVAGERLAVTGDTRFDRVLARRAEARPLPLSGAGEGFCLVAGSTWPPEEDMLLDAFAELRAGQRDLRLLLVPHEPTAASIARLRAAAAARGLPLWTLGERPQLADGGVCVADRVGILPELYAAGQLALVGGGFGRGLHSVLEPAAHGLPVLCGPRFGRADEARRLVAAGGAFVLSDRAALLDQWRGFLEEPGRLARAQAAALAFAEAGAGALPRSLEFLSVRLAAAASREGA